MKYLMYASVFLVVLGPLLPAHSQERATTRYIQHGISPAGVAVEPGSITNNYAAYVCALGEHGIFVDAHGDDSMRLQVGECRLFNKQAGEGTMLHSDPPAGIDEATNVVTMVVISESFE